MEELLKKIEESCTLYYNNKLDESSFQKVIDEIPAKIWQNSESALAIVKALVENEHLYEISLNKPVFYAEFICALLPQSFRENSDYIIATAKIISDFFVGFGAEVIDVNLNAVFSCMPKTPWDDDRFSTAAANLVIDRAYIMDLNCISEVIPESVWKNDGELCWLVRRLFNADERNMLYLSLFPKNLGNQ